jgi:hypothetical protein
MRLIPVHSSGVRAVGYEEERRVLSVQFIDGDLYEYYGVPASEVIDLFQAESIGRFVNKRIKPYTRTRNSEQLRDDGGEKAMGGLPLWRGLPDLIQEELSHSFARVPRRLSRLALLSPRGDQRAVRLNRLPFDLIGACRDFAAHVTIAEFGAQRVLFGGIGHAIG